MGGVRTAVGKAGHRVGGVAARSEAGACLLHSALESVGGKEMRTPGMWRAAGDAKRRSTADVAVAADPTVQAWAEEEEGVETDCEHRTVAYRWAEQRRARTAGSSPDHDGSHKVVADAAHLHANTAVADRMIDERPGCACDSLLAQTDPISRHKRPHTGAVECAAVRERTGQAEGLHASRVAAAPNAALALKAGVVVTGQARIEDGACWVD